MTLLFAIWLCPNPGEKLNYEVPVEVIQEVVAPTIQVIILDRDDIVYDSIDIPKDYQHLFNEMGGKYEIYPSLLAAIAKQESNFNPDAVSPKGAMGLMQLTPITILHLEQRYGLYVDPFDPRQAIEGAAAYLQELQSRFEGEQVLAAYNMGPTRLRRLDGDFSGIQETAHYVETVSNTIRDSMSN